MGESMELHPLAAIFGVMAGGEVAGILGIYLSIPVMAGLRIVFRRWRLYAEKKKFGPLTEYPLPKPGNSPAVVVVCVGRTLLSAGFDFPSAN